jgi:catechol 2,3-dioxygenase-like lactoylglutathione lyase family enzyme
MIRRIATQAVYVTDQKAAEEFWTGLGFEVRAWKGMGNGYAWLEVAPPGAESRIVPYPRAPMRDWETRRPSIVFECEDIDRFSATLKERRVDVGPAPRKMPWGIFTTLKDPDGNEFLLRG